MSFWGLTDSTLAPRFTLPGILKHPTIPDPLHGVNPRTILGRSWWDWTRKEVYAGNNFCCFACGTHKDNFMYGKYLEAHEAYTINYQTHRMYLSEVVALCPACHSFIHSGRLRYLLEANKLSEQKYNYVLQHGKLVLRKATPKNTPHYVIESLNSLSMQDPADTAWDEWRLSINGEEYPPLYKSREEWQQHFNEH